MATDKDGWRVFVEWDDGLNSDQNHEAAVRKFCRRMEYSGELVEGYLGRNGERVWVWVHEKMLTARVIHV